MVVNMPFVCVGGNYIGNYVDRQKEIKYSQIYKSERDCEKRTFSGFTLETFFFCWYNLSVMKNN
uniref:hypothetical protein n=1 Tax=Enterocloster clostridioformis TaxID=1531 RepID=UPI0025A63059